jgi:hypothetical protein
VVGDDRGEVEVHIHSERVSPGDDSVPRVAASTRPEQDAAP